MKLRYTAGINQVVVTIIFNLFNIVLVTHIFGACWYSLACYKCEIANWTKFLEYFEFDADNSWHWFIICFTTIGKLLMHNTRGLILSETKMESVMISSVMLLGFLIHYVIFVGRLIGVYSKRLRRRFLFYNNLECIKDKLAELNIDKKWRKKTIEYYSVFWKKHQGIIRMPSVFHNLPVSLQKEVTLDVFWEALRHSHLYGEEDISFKRELSLKIKSEFYLPDDYVYVLGKVKSKMVYIVSGILQVLTPEDEESALISFSSGTVLGEVTCMLPYKSNVYVQCATYCELHTLSINDVFSVLRNYTAKTRTLQQKCLQRVHTAKVLKGLSRKYSSLTSKSNILEDDTYSSIKWIKLQWRHLSKMREDSKRRRAPEALFYRCSRYLDLLVLSQTVELKTREICLSDTCPFIVTNNSSFIKTMRVVVLIAIVLQCIILPYLVAFKQVVSQEVFAFCFFLDAIYAMDIYLKMSTIIGRSGRVESKVINILLIRFKEMRFLVDLLATFPLDYCQLVLTQKYSALLKLNRLLKVYAILDYITKQEKDIWISTLTLRMLYLSIMYLMCGYWLICLMYCVTCFNGVCNPHGWFLYNSELDKAAGIDNPTANLPFVGSFFYVTFTYLGFGLSNKFVFVVSELIMHFVVVAIGYYIFSYCFSQLCALKILACEERHCYQDYLRAMNNFLTDNRIDKVLKRKIHAVLEFLWYYNKNKQAFGNVGILKDISPELSNEIEMNRRLKCISQIPLFCGLDEKILVKLTEHCTVKTLPANFVVIEKGKRSVWLHIILRGYCKLVSTVPGDEERAAASILKPQMSFPVIEVLHQVPSQVTVTTSTAVEIISIKYVDVKNILFANRNSEKEIQEALKEHFKTTKGLLLAGKARRLPKLIPEQRALGRGDYFDYQIFDTDVTSLEEKRYLEPFKKLGYLSGIRYLMRRKTINPHSKLFIAWEVFRCIVAVIRTVIAFLYFNLLIEYQPILRSTILIFLDLMVVIDIYIRFHCQYYNKVGILVTHPYFTSINYLKSSFVIDFISIFPVRILRIQELLGHSRKDMVFSYLITLARPLQLYRVVGALNYLQSDITRRGVLLRSVSTTFYVAVFVSAISFVIQRASCEIKAKEGGGLNYDCTPNAWIFSTTMPNTLDIFYVYIKTILASFTAFTSTAFGFFTISLLGETTMFIVLCTLSAVVRWVLVSRVLSHHVGGNATLTIYQDQVKTFLNFVKTETVDEELVNDVIAYYEYIWQRTKGGSIINTLKSLHANLHEDVVFTLYRNALESVEILQGADETLLKELGTVMVLRHFKKDSVVLQCNDVQSKLYIVYKGRVNLTIAGQDLCTLEQGGLFGCLKHKGVTRQTVTAKAEVHVVLLEIHSNLFYNLVSVFPEISRRLKKMNFLNQEFLEPKKTFVAHPKKSVLKPSHVTTRVLQSCMMAIRRKLAFLIKHNSPYYQWWEYIVWVHLAPITSILTMFFTILLTYENHQSLKVFWGILYASDAIFFLKVVFEFYLTYVDDESGITVTNLKYIRRRCIRSPWLYICIFTIVPFELIPLLATTDASYINFCLINRMVRVVFLAQYCQSSKNELNVKIHLRWTYLFYCFFLSVQAMTTLWWLVACKKGVCYYSESLFRHHGAKIVPANPGIDSVIIAYVYVINLLTATGLRCASPRTIPEALATILIICIFQLTLVAVITMFTTILTIQEHSINQYEYDIFQLRSYLEARDLSKPILKKVWVYTLQLWQRHRGESIPSIILEVPSYLKQHIMSALFGHHLKNHYLFQNSHVDFLRQLATHLVHCVFFPQNYIVEAGDKDGCMYFIHKGEVAVYYKVGGKETMHAILKEGEAFGEAQGLYNIRHNFSFQARTVVKALILKYSNWKYLLEWFPASYEEIKRAAAENLVHVGETQQ